MLSEAMRSIIRVYSAGSVATVNDDGTPSVSPKATFVILDDRSIAFGNIRSPGTLRNLRKRQAVEICFTDVLERKAVRVSGLASVVAKAQADDTIRAAFEKDWAGFTQYMNAFAKIDIHAAEMILSPAYDHGASEEELRQANLDKLNSL